VAVAITALAIVLFSVPSSFEHFRSMCSAASEVCSQRAVGQPTTEGVRALRDVGLSVRSYAMLNIAIDKVFELVWFAVGVLIFWRTHPPTTPHNAPMALCSHRLPVIFAAQGRRLGQQDRRCVDKRGLQHGCGKLGWERS
jgi:hypothetical protein